MDGENKELQEATDSLQSMNTNDFDSENFKTTEKQKGKC